jgi:hypothetical protein
MLLDVQVITRPVRTLLLASRVTAVNWTLAPICKVVLDGETETVATGAGGGAGALTVMTAAAVWPSLDAEICTDPEAIAVTRPSAETVAMLVLPELQTMVRPVRTLLLASRVTAATCTVPPICNAAVVGETVTDATGTGAGTSTVSEARPVCPSLEAVIVAVPAPTAVTSPVDATVATLD